MGRPQHPSAFQAGFSLLELLFVLVTLGVCLAIGAVGVVEALRTREAKSAAECWQSAAAWAQAEALWRGGDTRLTWREGTLSLDGPCEPNGESAGDAPAVGASTNVPRWRTDEGLAVGFTGALASPDSGGSLYFSNGGGTYRVAVRPESGLTARTVWEPGQ